jgi:hypothetical protein
MAQLEKFFEDLFLKKIPWQLPVKAKEVIVKIAPWIVLIILIVSIPGILAVFGLSAFVGGMATYYGAHLGSRFYLGWIVLVVQFILMAMSFSGLKQRKLKGWRFAYYSSLVSAVYGVISAYNISGIIWSLISAGIGLYILFQVRSYYNGSAPAATPPVGSGSGQPTA